MNANQCVSDAEKNRIEEKIAGIESKSSAEIICAIATESGRYDRAESIFGLTGSILCLALAESIYSSFQFESYTGEALFIPFGWQSLALVIGFILGNGVASILKPLRSIVVLNNEKTEEVHRAANHIFYTSRIHSTENQNGMLIYLSLFERKIIIRADDGILRFIPESELHEIIHSVLPSLKQHEIANALCSILDQLEHKLVTGLPIQEYDQNKLSNELLFFHPRP